MLLLIGYVMMSFDSCDDVTRCGSVGTETANKDGIGCEAGGRGGNRGISIPIMQVRLRLVRVRIRAYDR